MEYKENGDLFVSRTKYVKELLKKAGTKTCKQASTLAKPHTQLLMSEGKPLNDPSFYMSLVGALQQEDVVLCSF